MKPSFRSAQFVPHAPELRYHYSRSKFRVQVEDLADYFAFRCQSASGTFQKQFFEGARPKLGLRPRRRTVIRQRLQGACAPWSILESSRGQSFRIPSMTALFPSTPPRIPPIRAKSSSCLQKSTVIQTVESSKGLARNRLTDGVCFELWMQIPHLFDGALIGRLTFEKSFD